MHRTWVRTQTFQGAEHAAFMVCGPHTGENLAGQDGSHAVADADKLLYHGKV